MVFNWFIITLILLRYLNARRLNSPKENAAIVFKSAGASTGGDLGGDVGAPKGGQGAAAGISPAEQTLINNIELEGKAAMEAVGDSLSSSTDKMKTLLTNTTGGVLHPITSAKNMVASVSNVMSGGTLGADLMSNDRILNSAARASKRSPHMLNDAVPLPGEELFPPRINTLQGYPNPLKDPLGCHRRERNESYVCDPDDVLGHQNAEEVEEVLAEVRKRCTHPCGMSFSDEGEKSPETRLTPCTIVVAVMRNLPHGSSGDSMATNLLRRWNIGHEDCQDGVILLYSAANHRVFVQWDKGEENRLNQHAYAAISPVLEYTFKTNSLNNAFTQAITLIDLQQSGKVPQPRHTAQLYILIPALIVSFLLFLGFFVSSITRKPAGAEPQLQEVAPLRSQSNSRHT